MTLPNPNFYIDTSFTGKNIATGTSVFTFTATGSLSAQFQVRINNATGTGGDYILWAEHKWGGTGTATTLPKTTYTIDAGKTVIGFPSIEVFLRIGDVVDVFVDGLAGEVVNGNIRIAGRNNSVFDAASDLVYVGGPVGISGSISTSVSDADIQRIWTFVRRTLTITPEQVYQLLKGIGLIVYRNVDLDLPIGGLNIPSNWQRIYGTIKKKTSKNDSQSELQLMVSNPPSASDGVIIIHGSDSGASQTKGAIIVNQASGTANWSVEDDVMGLLEIGDYVYDMKVLTPSGSSLLFTQTPIDIYDPVTWSIT